ncbi:hypothetical protein NA640_11915 [Pseudomonas xanthomarina]|uniref:hypothetical protein n=1 Tax=Stutzerimonas xanthomarina TaxID=271420 RepID=UPI0020CE6049|nr:hypothetical protein [Stutzerimonas xanthomarina]MCP9339281.1 hypothetical protein [Stutzerimonas xanthomarina]
MLNEWLERPRGKAYKQIGGFLFKANKAMQISNLKKFGDSLGMLSAIFLLCAEQCE